MNSEIKEIKEYFDYLKLDKSKNTIRSYATAIDLFLEFSKINNFLELKKITSQDLRNFQMYLKNSGVSLSSINARIRPIKAMLNWMVDNSYIEVSPAYRLKDLKVGKKIPAFLSEEEVDVMINACKNDLDKLIVALLVTTGLRREELTSLRLKDYDGLHITVNGKGNKQRVLILQEDVVKLMNKWIEKRNKKYGKINDYIFVSKAKTKFDGSSILRKIKSIMRDGGFEDERIKQIHTHSLRHTFVANLFEYGADIYTAQVALGHENLTTTQIYSHLRNSALDKSMLNMKPVLSKKG